MRSGNGSYLKRVVSLLLLSGSLLLFGCGNENLPPLAGWTADRQEGYAPLQVVFDGSQSSDPDGYIVSYSWSFGDGETAHGKQVEHVFGDDGEYTVTLTVQDNRGREDSASGVITVYNPPPVPSFTYSPAPPVAGEPVTFDAGGSYDPASVRPMTVVRLLWSFGDGDEGEGAVTQHTYSSPGSYTVTLTAFDDDGASASTEAEVEVILPPPPSPSF